MQAQNLIPNPGFEDQIDCPYHFHDIVAEPWEHGNEGTTDHLRSIKLSRPGEIYFEKCGA